jgi:hypothetical protein
MTLKRTLLTALIAAGCSAALVVAAEPRTGARSATAGDLVRGLARAAEAAGPEVAGSVTARLELAVPVGRADALLTEALAVDILRAVGVDASTRTPDRLVSQDRLGSLLAGAAGGLSGAAAAWGGSPVSAQPATLADCFTRANHGQCVECCKAMGLRANTCAKSCFVINKPSPSEPLP